MKLLLVTEAMLALTKATNLRVHDGYGNVYNGISNGLNVARVQSQEECDMIHADDQGVFVFNQEACACF